MTEFQKLKSFGTTVLYSGVILGISDMIIQTFTKGHTRIIKSILETLFGVR